jgi:hypothetical protein
MRIQSCKTGRKHHNGAVIRYGYLGSRGREDLFLSRPIFSLKLLHLLPRLKAVALTFTMASNRDRTSATWSRDDVATLVHTLAKEKAQGNWVDNRPQGVAWTSCEHAFMDSERKSGGGVKSLQSIQNRWQRVRPRRLPNCMRLSRVYSA